MIGYLTLFHHSTFKYELSPSINTTMKEEPDEKGNIMTAEHLLIRDVTTGEVILNKRPYQKEKKNDQ